MKIYSVRKTFFIMLLIFSLCADTVMTVCAGEDASGTAPLQDSTSSGSETLLPQQPAENASTDDTSTDDMPAGDSPTDSIPAENLPADQASSDNMTTDDSLADDADNTPSNDLEYESSPVSDENNSPAEMHESSLAPEAASLAPEAVQAAEGETTSITISAAGDCTLGIDSRYSHNFNTYYRKKGSSYFFKKVKSVFSRDDITIVNFEGTLTTSTKRAKKVFTFKGPKKYASILKKGSVEVVNLANNHSKDYGKVSLTDTQKTMKKNKIGYCYNSTISYQTVNNVKTAFLGFNALEKLTKKQVKTAINKAKKNKAKIIIVSFHWGIERKYYPNARQKSFGHYAIDCGASLVLGHHPHVLQGIEQYQGRYIVYSLGNFCFGGNSNPSDKDTMIFQQTFYIKDGVLQTKNNAKIIPCSLSSHKNTNDFQPRILSGSEKKRLIKKVNTLSKRLKVSIDSKGNIKSAK